MTSGVLLFAYNNSHIDYAKHAIFCAKNVKNFLNLPVSVVTDSKNYIQRQYAQHTDVFDSIIEDKTSTEQIKKFYNGKQYKKLTWNNHSRPNAYDLTPYEKTLVMDTDYIVSNNSLLNCFDNDRIKITKDFIDLCSERDDKTLLRVSDYSIPMLWATVFYFSKASKSSKILFDLIKHIQENWNFYRLQYQIVGKNYRNDFAFSIALHIMSNPQVDLPGTHYYTTDRDKLYNGNGNSFQFFLENQTACGIHNQNIHMMNKFDLNEHIDKVMQ